MQAMNNNPIMQFMQTLKNGNDEQIFNGLMQNNPQFRAFMEQNKGKTPEQVAKENGVDLNAYLKMM